MDWLFDKEDDLIRICADVEQMSEAEFSEYLQEELLPELNVIAHAFSESAYELVEDHGEAGQEWVLAYPDSKAVADSIKQSIETLKTATHKEAIAIVQQLPSATAPMSAYLEQDRIGYSYMEDMADAASY